MAKLVDWMKKAVERLSDPDRDARIAHLTATIHHALCTQRERFSLASAVQGIEFSPSDLETARENVFRAILGRGWADEQLTNEERQVARWAASSLGLAAEQAGRIHLEFARERFAVALAQSMEDGVLEPHEESRLQRIAASVKCTLPVFARSFFRQEGEAFLRGMFGAFADGEGITGSNWSHLLDTTRKLGIEQTELLTAIRPQAQRYVERVLADAKADGRLSEREESYLRWIISTLELPTDARRYIEDEMELLKCLNRIEEGQLPVVQTPMGTEIRSGEILHFFAAATWHLLRERKNGPEVETHQGSLFLTDNRLIFSSASKSQSTSYRKIIAHRGTPTWLEVQVEGKPASRFQLLHATPTVYPILRSAIAMANQTLVRSEGQPTRHIPRDVRQRIWQKCGGRCIECGAADYLEFDHIIPVARGGSNSDANVQLLCRRCNLKKSDNI